ncbi:MAG: cyclase family protein [Alicyclobacillus macrosporangiidus]|uniref:cyclase family protein n=1 Tax=Alicyclobacillus macrosporangiidus TaxID=392015 RepID=UPI0026EA1154|nr:cyclase family protein [Alicyclobacillus macrosporangiidus]MCL6599941.1 cyclase family protein [Alicyclobacillus macrosporangiidus]
MPRVIDISAPIYEGMPVYKNKPEKQPSFQVTSDFSTGSAHETRVSLDAHTGTHVDAPLHMIPGGATLETIPLTQWLGPCRVIDLTGVQGGITRADLEKHAIQPGEFVLLKTRNSDVEGFDPAFVYLAEDGAHFLAEAGVRGVGIDALGIERSQPGHETHKVLFEHGVVIIEGLRLAGVEAKSYWLVAPPLRLLGTDAAPARALLLELGPGESLGAPV